jgi:hypothetical protein
LSILLLNLAATELEQSADEKLKRGAIWQILNQDNFYNPLLDD